MHNTIGDELMKSMNTHYFDDYESFVCEVDDMYDSMNDDFKTVGIIAKYEEAKEILQQLICIGYDIAHIKLYDELFDEYYDEYIINLTSSGIYCEKFKHKNEYIKEDSTITYVSNECNSACLKHIDSNKILCFEIDSEEYEIGDDLEIGLWDDGCDCCEECCPYEYDEDMHGFTATRNSEDGYSSVSFYSTEKIDTNEMKDLLEIFGL